MKKRKGITIMLCTIAIIAILIIIPFINIKKNENIILCEKEYNNLKENDITISELAVEVCGSDNKRYGTAREACEAGVKYYSYTCPGKTSILQIIIDKLNN